MIRPQQGEPIPPGVDAMTETVRPWDDLGSENAPPQAAFRASNWRKRFVATLNNKDKEKRSDARTRGFIAFAPGAPSLQSVQVACMDQGYNTCLTARYRLRSGPVIGNLLHAFLTDLRTLAEARRDAAPPRTIGDLLPLPLQDPSSDPWGQVLYAPGLVPLIDAALASHARNGRGRLSASQIRDLFELLSSPETLRVGMRLVLLAEGHALPPDAEKPSAEAYVGSAFMRPPEWQATLEEIAPILPERMGIVTSITPDESTIGETQHLIVLDDVDQGGGQAEDVARYLPSALTSDQPTTVDHLGLGRYADGLARLILHPGTGPLTVGVHGEWGKGKSSFMRMVRRSLSLYASSNVEDARALQAFGPGGAAVEAVLGAIDVAGEEYPDAESSRSRLTGWRAAFALREQVERRMERVAANDVICVEFNAWQHQDAEHIWAGLVHEVSRAIEHELPRRARLWTPLLHAWRQRRGELIAGLIIPVVVAVLVGAVAVWAGLTDASGTAPAWLRRLPNGLVPVASGALALWFAVSRVYSVLNPLSKRILSYVQMPNYRQHLGFQQRIVEDLRFLRGRLEVKRWRRPERSAWQQTLREQGGAASRALKPKKRLLPRRALHRPRMVVFIDDLDRCEDHTIMQVLQTVNLVLGASEMFVFLAMDNAKVYRAIEQHYTADGKPPPTNFAEEYLKKIIQLSFHLPPAVESQRFALIAGLFSQGARSEYEARRAAQTRDGDSGSDAGGAGAAYDLFRYDPDAAIRPRIQHVREVEDTGEELMAFEDLNPFIGDNPRELKRLVNVHRLVKILLERPEARPTKEAQRRLVGWLVFCMQWPDLIDDMMRSATRPATDSDCILEVASTSGLPADERTRLGEFSRILGAEAALKAEDLRPGSLLADAARIALMVRDEPPVAAPAGGERPDNPEA